MKGKRQRIQISPAALIFEHAAHDLTALAHDANGCHDAADDAQRQVQPVANQVHNKHKGGADADPDQVFRCKHDVLLAVFEKQTPAACQMQRAGGRTRCNRQTPYFQSVFHSLRLSAKTAVLFFWSKKSVVLFYFIIPIFGGMSTFARACDSLKTQTAPAAQRCGGSRKRGSAQSEPRCRGKKRDYSKTVPLAVRVTTCQGMHFPLFCRAFFAACSSPPQQGTSMRTTVMLLMSLLRRISVSFSE